MALAKLAQIVLITQKEQWHCRLWQWWFQASIWCNCSHRRWCPFEITSFFMLLLTLCHAPFYLPPQQS